MSKERECDAYPAPAIIIRGVPLPSLIELEGILDYYGVELPCKPRKYYGLFRINWVQ
jgi:hypothetical protein